MAANITSVITRPMAPRVIRMSRCFAPKDRSNRLVNGQTSSNATTTFNAYTSGTKSYSSDEAPPHWISGKGMPKMAAAGPSC